MSNQEYIARVKFTKNNKFCIVDSEFDSSINLEDIMYSVRRHILEDYNIVITEKDITILPKPYEPKISKVPTVEFKVIHMQGIGKYRIYFKVTNLNDRRRKYRYEFLYPPVKDNKVNIEVNRIYHPSNAEEDEAFEYLDLLFEDFNFTTTLDNFIAKTFVGKNEQN